MSESIRFVAPLPPVALRRNSETTHKGYRSKLVREYQEQVWCAGWGEVGSPCKDQDGMVYTSQFTTRNRMVLRGWGGVTTGAGDPTEYIFLPWEKAHLVLTWRHHRQGPDHDNALASLKPLIDVLKATGPRPLGIFVDDNPDCLTIDIKTEKVSKKQDEGVVVEVSRR